MLCILVVSVICLEAACGSYSYEFTEEYTDDSYDSFSQVTSPLNPGSNSRRVRWIPSTEVETVSIRPTEDIKGALAHILSGREMPDNFISQVTSQTKSTNLLTITTYPEEDEYNDIEDDANIIIVPTRMEEITESPHRTVGLKRINVFTASRSTHKALRQEEEDNAMIDTDNEVSITTLATTSIATETSISEETVASETSKMTETSITEKTVTSETSKMTETSISTSEVTTLTSSVLTSAMTSLSTNLTTLTTISSTNATTLSTASTTKPIHFDVEKFLEIIANLTYDYDTNLTMQVNETLQRIKAPTCPTPPPPTTTTVTVPDVDYSGFNGTLVAKCFVCGLQVEGIPITASCADAFAGDFLPLVPQDPRARSRVARYRKYCRYGDIRNFYINESYPRAIYGQWTGGCAVRWTDVTGVYTQRTCRNRRRPTTGRHFASKRMAKLEFALMHEDNGCIISPVATLLPLSRGISLFARFHACVCTGSWCNTATRCAFTFVVLFVVVVHRVLKV